MLCRPGWASIHDLAALLLLFLLDVGYKVLPFFWIPKESSRSRAERDRIPYDTWVARGLITATEGAVIDYDVIRRDINGLNSKYNIQQIGFDPHNSTQIRSQIEGDGIQMIEIHQGFLSLNPPTKELERLVISGELQHDGNEVLRWNASNVSVTTDAAGNLKPDKERSMEKIDGISALINGLSRAMVEAPSSGRLMEII